jgi:hypothetical protein
LGNSSVTERLAVSQEGLSFMELVVTFVGGPVVMLSHYVFFSHNSLESAECFTDVQKME